MSDTEQKPRRPRRYPFLPHANPNLFSDVSTPFSYANPPCHDASTPFYRRHGQLHSFLYPRVSQGGGGGPCPCPLRPTPSFPTSHLLELIINHSSSSGGQGCGSVQVLGHAQAEEDHPV